MKLIITKKKGDMITFDNLRYEDVYRMFDVLKDKITEVSFLTEDKKKCPESSTD